MYPDIINESVEKNKDNEEELAEHRRLELQQLKEQLKEWEIHFFDLIKESPKQESARLMVSQVVRFILSRRGMLEKTKESKTLPMDEIEKYLKIPRKKIETCSKIYNSRFTDMYRRLSFNKRACKFYKRYVKAKAPMLV